MNEVENWIENMVDALNKSELSMEQKNKVRIVNEEIQEFIDKGYRVRLLDENVLADLQVLHSIDAADDLIYTIAQFIKLETLTRDGVPWKEAFEISAKEPHVFRFMKEDNNA